LQDIPVVERVYGDYFSSQRPFLFLVLILTLILKTSKYCNQWHVWNGTVLLLWLL